MLEFQIPKASISTIIDIFQERLKIGIIKLCRFYSPNPWYPIEKVNLANIGFSTLQ